MGMVHKGGNAVPFHGDHHPVGIYIGSQTIFEPIDQAQDGKTITFENTYNDVAEVTVFGESKQDGEPTPDNPVQIVSRSSACIETCGRNIVRNAIIYPANSCQVSYNRYHEIDRFIDREVTISFDFDVTKDCVYPVNVYNYQDAGIGIGLTNSLVEFKNVKAGKTYHYEKTGTLILQEYGWSWNNNGTFIVYPAYPDDRTDNIVMIRNFQIELGSEAHPYEPFKGTTIDLTSLLEGRELRSLPDGTRDELVVHRDGTVELVLRCDASMFDPSYPVSSEWKLATPQTIQLPSIDPLPTYHPYTFVDGNGADISARVRVIPETTSKMLDEGVSEWRQ